MAETIYLKNRPEFVAAMQRLKSAPSGNALVSIARAGILPIQNAAIMNAPYLTGTLRRSIQTSVISASTYSAMVVTGTDVAYARRIEYGFNGTDALGRTYNQGARAFMRPAYAAERSAAIAEVTNGLKALISSVI